jgi:broad specificity phosphatase PhoE
MHNKKITIMTIRHGETDFNCQKRYAGLLDVPLNAKGIRDCRTASDFFVDSVDLVVTSKLKRSIQTARIFVNNKKSIVESVLCNERNFGKMQGHTSQEVEFIKPEIKYIKIAGDFHSLNPPQGEKFPALHKRANEFLKFLRFLLSEHRCLRVLVVSHEVFLQQFHGVLRGETWRESMRHRLPNLTLSIFILQGNCVLCESSRKLIPESQESWHSISIPQPGNAACRTVDLAHRQQKQLWFRELRNQSIKVQDQSTSTREKVFQRDV